MPLFPPAFSAATFDTKQECVLATAAALPANTYNNGAGGAGATLTGNANGPPTIDGVVLIAGFVGQRVLVKNEATAANNGIYTISQIGVVAVSPYILTRATDADLSADLGPGILVPVAGLTGSLGVVNDGKLFLSAASTPFTTGTTSISFALVGATYTAGSGLALTGTAFSSLQSATTITATNAAWPIPTGATVLEITAVGGGGQGGGAGSAAAAQLEAGGGGGGAGAFTRQFVSVGANTTLNVTIGAGGSAAGGGGGAGGNAGTAGSNGSDTTVTGTGISVTGTGGSGGQRTTASSATAVGGGIYGQNVGAIFLGSGTIQIGCGGPSAAQGGAPLGSSGGGGSGGAAATATNGGNGGNAGTLAGISAAGSGNTGSSAGANGGNAGANTGGGGGGGGGGAAGTGAGGNGGNGGSGYVTVRVLY